MSSQRAEIRTCMRHWLGESADDVLSQGGFIRRKNALVYSRKTEGGVQKINVHVEHGPRERRDSAAAVDPRFTVYIKDVNELIDKMVAGQPELGGDSSITLSGPVAWTAPQGSGARWYLYQPDSVPEVVETMVSFLTERTIPYLNSLRNAADLSVATTEGENPVAKTWDEVLRVIAARILCGRRDEARALLEKRFGRPGPRRMYRSVFDYLDAITG